MFLYEERKINSYIRSIDLFIFLKNIYRLHYYKEVFFNEVRSEVWNNKVKPVAYVFLCATLYLFINLSLSDPDDSIKSVNDLISTLSSGELHSLSLIINKEIPDKKIVNSPSRIVKLKNPETGLYVEFNLPHLTFERPVPLEEKILSLSKGDIGKLIQILNKHPNIDDNFSCLSKSTYEYFLSKIRKDNIRSVLSPILISLITIFILYTLGAYYVKTNSINHRNSFNILCYFVASQFLVLYSIQSITWYVTHDKDAVIYIFGVYGLLYNIYMYGIFTEIFLLGYIEYLFFWAVISTLPFLVYLYVDSYLVDIAYQIIFIKNT